MKKYVSKWRQRRLWQKAVMGLACVVVFCTVYALILPAIALENTTHCGKTEHQHSDTCYTETLICGQEEAEGHTHTVACYSQEPVLICGQEESEEHTHTEACYSQEPVLICDQEEAEGHVHTQECYEKVLTCESEEHVHDQSCYSDVNADVETAADWEATLPAEELTGIWADDLIAVAESQLGYAESKNNYNVTEDGEQKGYTRYGAWYGDPYGDWCAMFASFCLNYAEIPAEAVPREAGVQNWIDKLSGTAEGYQDYDLYVEAEGYTPVRGDLVFFDTDKDEKADHMGIVAEYKEEGLLTKAQIKTIEGNSSDQVKNVTYDLDDEQIMGYAVLPFNPDKELTQTYEGDDYLVTVNYPAEAKIPADAELLVSEYAKDSDIYQERYTEAAELYGWTGDKSDQVRLFNIGFYVDGEEIEPAAPVSVRVTYYNQEESKNYEVTHFGEEGTEKVSSFTDYDNGAQTVDFDLDSFSDIMLLAVDTGNLDGKTFALVNGKAKVAMTATKVSGANRLCGTRTTASIRRDSAGMAYFQAYSDDELQSLETELETIKIWAFEQSGNGYYISTTANGSKQYLKIENDDVTLVDKAEASLITVTEGTGALEGQVRLAVKLTNTSDRAINLYGGDVTRGFGGYSDNKENEYFYLINDVRKPGTVKGETPSSTIINMFDYWRTDQISATGDFQEGRLPDSGINNGHALKFDLSTSGMNGYTNSMNVYQGIVEKNLLNGYPKLPSGESLDYLFNPDTPVIVDGKSYKESYRNVSGMLQVNSEGYYYYNSQENFAELNQDTNEITLYDTWGVQASGSSPNGQFFPFNAFGNVISKKSNDKEINHYFGMNLITRFVQQHGGYTEAVNGKPMVFEFSGDDDVWIFVDGVLVADLGGIHDAASVKIDFSTGDVVINENSAEFEKRSTLLGAFTAAGAEGKTTWNDNTFADNTYHTLKFYYLERGNHDSNLLLKYNLKDIPASSIVKVDQYGEPVPNAVFALYAANKVTTDTGESVYKYLVDGDEDDNLYLTLKDIDQYYKDQGKEGSYNIDESTGVIGDFTYNGVGRSITPIYFAKTDSEGTITFVDQDGLPLTLEELDSKNTDHFILREIKRPDGYRQLADEIWLYLQNGVLLCDDVYKTGVWSATNVLETATNDLYLTENSAPDATILGDKWDNTNYYIENEKKVKYYNVDREERPVYGTLFAVVLKYNNTTGNGLKDEKNWSPIYGSDLSGYTVVKADYDNAANNREPFVEAALTTAKLASQYGDVTFSLSSSGAMQVLLKNMPGDITAYYHMIYQTYEGSMSTEDLNTKLANETKYTVAFYWTPEDSLDTATAQNTFRVDAELKEGRTGFDRAYGATIAIPNLINRMFVQKRDLNGNLVNGATFALYNVVETGDDIYYVADNGSYIQLAPDDNRDNIGTATIGTASYDYKVASNGMITVGTIDDTGEILNPIARISPAKNANNNPVLGDTEGATELTGENGTFVLSNLNDGTYYLREIAAPDGFVLNTNEVMILVDDTAIYANAGVADDGINVARGPGYVVSTLGMFAAQGDVDNTLSWIYAQLKVSGESHSFADPANHANWSYLVDGTETTTEPSAALTTYLKHDTGEEANTLFNYTQNEGRTTGEGNQKVATTRRLYNSVGWSHLAIYQDYEYGSKNKNPDANYTDLRGYGDISNLFSRSVYVQVTDEYNSLTIKKVDSTNDNTLLEGAEFHLSRVTTDENNQPVTSYYRCDADTGAVTWVSDEEEQSILTTKEDGTVSLSGLSDGTYTLTEIKAPAGYNLLANSITFTVKNGYISANSDGTIAVYDADSNVLTVKNSKGISLPHTGGVGTHWYIISGFTLMAGVLLYSIFRRRRGSIK